MNRIRTAAIAATATAVVAPLMVMTATAAHADGKDREFRVAGAEVDFSVEKDDGRFEVDVDLDDARPGSAWRIKLVHDGKVFHNRVHRADREGDIEIDKRRKNTAGKDTFKVVVTKVGGPKRSAVLTLR